jgi:enamine deaminase RidA (YjgF/YER057c/UK114 family)
MHGFYWQSTPDFASDELNIRYEKCDMKSVLNAAARRQMEAVKERIGPEALEAAAKAIRLRTEDDLHTQPEDDMPAPAKVLISPTRSTGQPLANYLAAKRVGDTLYMSGVIAVDPAAQKVITRYDELPTHAREQLRRIGYDTGQLSVDIFESAIVAQSWFVLQRIGELAQQHGAKPGDVFKLVQYFRDLRHYPAYNRVRQLFYPQGVVSTVVEVSRMLPSDAVLVEVEATASLQSSSQ